MPPSAVVLTTRAGWAWKAPMSTVPLTIGEAALVGGDTGGNEGVVARADGRAAGQQGHGLGRAAVIAQRRQHGLSGLAMVPVRSEPTQPELPSVSPIRLWPWEVKVSERHRARWSVAVFPATMVLPMVTVPARVVHAAAVRGGVAADGAVGQRGRAVPCR